MHKGLCVTLVDVIKPAYWALVHSGRQADRLRRLPATLRHLGYRLAVALYESSRRCLRVLEHATATGGEPCSMLLHDDTAPEVTETL